ncbi:MAG: hypothetical protein ABFC63_02765 [Thermoguttaceae bacterium]
MGALKEKRAEQDARQIAATEIGLKVGLLERCELHGAIYDAMNDFALEDAFRYGEALMTKNDPSVAVFAGNRKRLHLLLENIRTGLPNCCDECYYASQQRH